MGPLSGERRQGSVTIPQEQGATVEETVGEVDPENLGAKVVLDQGSVADETVV